jgi:hypothetical protein
MMLNHVATILVCSGPLLYAALWMVLDPAGIEWLIEFVVGVFRNSMRTAGRLPSREVEQAAASRRLRARLRLAGVALLLVAIVI